MMYIDDSFPYLNYKGKGHYFETYSIQSFSDEEEKVDIHIDYAKDLGMYRITKFVDGHWNGDIVFDEVEKKNAYCPICDERRWIPDVRGYCYKCGHHLNTMEELLK